MVERKLGRGLDFLIKRPASPEPPPAVEDAVPEPAAGSPFEVAVDEILPNPFQPRRTFGIEQLNELIESIRLHGVLQPIAVRRSGRGYEIVSGERRWRACQELGLERIPAVVREADDQTMLELALIENIQREDLDAIEKAKAYRQLIREFELTQEQAAQRLSVKRSTVANHLRLLDLDGEIQELVAVGEVSMGHARALLALEQPQRRLELARRVKKDGLSVRDVERLAGAEKKATGAPTAARRTDPNLEAVEERMRRALGTKVSLKGGARRGRVTIEYYDAATLQRLLELVEGARIAGEGA